MRLKHPIHGFHNPMPGEREAMLAAGWVEDVPAAPAKAAELDEIPVATAAAFKRPAPPAKRPAPPAKHAGKK